MIHRLKTLPRFFKALDDDSKPFEVRLNDRDYKVGDVLILKEWDDKTERFTGDYVVRRVTYVLDEKPFVPDGYVIMGLRGDD